MKKAAWLATIKYLKVGGKVRVVLRGFPFEDYVREGKLVELTEARFALDKSWSFSRSYHRAVSMAKAAGVDQ
jgi:hypothetical protein